MNIFLFDPLNLETQAQAHPDKLIVKMQLEASQLLANSVHFYYDLLVPKKDKTFYKQTHTKHPCSVWMNFDKSHCAYTLQYLKSLIDSYESRYKKPSSFQEVYNYICNNTDLLNYTTLPQTFAIAINEFWLKIFLQDKIISFFQYSTVLKTKRANAFLAKTLYTNYLLYAKSHYAQWRYSEPPSFWKHPDLSDHFSRFCKI